MSSGHSHRRAASRPSLCALLLLGAALGLAPGLAAAQTAHSGNAVNFGSIQAGSSSGTMPVTFTFDSGGTIEAPAVLTMGAANLDFTDAGTGSCTTNGTSHIYNSSDTCTVNVEFSPRVSGERRGGVVLKNSSGAVIATAYIYGIGTGPQVAFSPSTISMVGGGFAGTLGVAVDGSGNVYLIDNFHDAVVQVPPGCASSACVKSIGGGFGSTSGTLGPPVAVDGAGNIYVSDDGNHDIKEIPAGCVSAACVTILSSIVSGASGIAVDGAGKLYVLGDASHWGYGIFQIPPGCASITCLVLHGPINVLGGETMSALAIDSSGNFYWSALKMAPGCASSTCIAYLGGGFSDAEGAAVDAGGNVYVADHGAAAVKEIPAGCASSACVVTLAGGFKGASGVAVDGSGNVYVSATAEAQGMEIHRATRPSLAFASTVAGETSTDSPQTVTVQNIGNAALDFSSVTYPTDFPEASGVNSDCTGSTNMAAGASCTLSIDFSPLPSSVIGSSTALSESVSLTDNTLNAANAMQSVAVSGTETAGPTPYVTSPSPGTALGGSTTFSWNPGSGVSQFQLYIGTTGPGSRNFYWGPDLPGTATSSSSINIPLNGATLYVRFWYQKNSAWTHEDLIYTEASPPSFTKPSASTRLGGPTTFSWNSGSGMDEFQLYIGTTGAGSKNVYWGPDLPGTATSSASINIPTNGATLYVRLWFEKNGIWGYRDFTYTEATPPSIFTPAPGSTISGPTIFTWNPGSGVQQFQLYIGTTGVGSSNAYKGPDLSGSTTSSPSITVPTNGATLNVRLWYLVNTSWQYRDYTYTEAP